MHLNISLKATLNGHKAAIFGLTNANNKQPKHFYSTDGNGWVVEWDIEQPEQGMAIVQVPSNIFALQQLSDTKTLVIGTMQGNLYRADIAQKHLIAPIESYERSIFDLQEYNEQLLIACGNGHLYTKQIADWHNTQDIALSNKSLRQLARQEDLIAVAASDMHIYLLHAPDLSLIARLEHHQNSVFAVCFSPCGQYLLSGGRDAALCIWDIKRHELLHHIPAHLSTINAITYSPDGAYVVTAGRDRSIKFWQSSNFKLLKVIDPSKTDLPSHKHSVNRLLWLDNRYLVSAGDDKQLFVWDISTTY